MKKNKFSNILTKGNETQNQSNKSKQKIFKAFGFGSLAVMMAVAGTFAFAPLGASPSVASASEYDTQVSQNLIIPKADDPTIYTTESGLEIKWGNAATASGNANETGTYNYSSYTGGAGLPTNTVDNKLTSGNLSGFPYFTTSKNGTTYTWVIIGRNANVSTMNNATTISGSQSSSKIEYRTMSEWKSKISNSDTYPNFVAGYSPTYKNFFNNSLESNTPAGAAINSHLDKEYGARNYSASLSYSYPQVLTVSSVKTSTEIPAGCVLCLANGITGTSAWTTAASNSTGYWCPSTGYYGGTGNNLSKLVNSYYTNDTFGFGSHLNRFKSITISQQAYYYTVNVRDVSITTSTSLKMFVLGSHSADNFKYSTYLTAAQVKLSSEVWLRSMTDHTAPYYLNTSGNTTTAGSYSYSCGYSKGVRPAFVMSIS